MRRSTASVCLAALLAACRAEPPAANAGAAARQEAERPAPAAPDAMPAGPRGDRHARAAARRSHVVRRVTGTVARADDRAVVVGRGDAAPLTLRIAPGTAVTLDGRPARAEALPPGADVRAAYRTGDGDRPTALTVEARRAPLAPGAAAPAEAWQGSPDPAPIDGG